MHIKSKKLGCLHYSIQALILIYVVIWVIVLQKGYQGTDAVVGSVSIKVKGSCTLLRLEAAGNGVGGGMCCAQLAGRLCLACLLPFGTLSQSPMPLPQTHSRFPPCLLRTRSLRDR